MNLSPKIYLIIGIIMGMIIMFYILTYDNFTVQTPENDIDEVEHFVPSQNNISVEKISDTERFIKIKSNLFWIYFKETAFEKIHQTLGGIKIQTPAVFELNPSYMQLYDEIGNLDKSQNAVFVYPTFTASAYLDNGFYDYYEGKCDICTTISLYDDLNIPVYLIGGTGAVVLKKLGYDYITDIDIDKNPDILQEYDKIILLHNEYVTKREFDAITSHPNVVYLYPNALYAEIDVDYDQKTITLIRGHGYPSQEIDNGFDWEFDNTRPYEFDTDCIDWKFKEIDNGMMLDCYPEYVIYTDADLLRKIKEF